MLRLVVADERLVRHIAAYDLACPLPPDVLVWMQFIQSSFSPDRDLGITQLSRCCSLLEPVRAAAESGTASEVFIGSDPLEEPVSMEKSARSSRPLSYPLEFSAWW